MVTASAITLSNSTLLSATKCAIRNDENAIIFTTAGNPHHMVCSVTDYETSPCKGNLEIIATIDKEGNFAD
jgi:hypothetical protein